MFNHKSEEYRRYRHAVEDLKLQYQREQQHKQLSDDKYDPIRTFEEDLTNHGVPSASQSSSMAPTSAATTVAQGQIAIMTPSTLDTAQPKPEKMVYASIDKSDSSDSDTEYMREAKKRNLKNLRQKARFPDNVSQVRKRNADSTDSEDDTDNSRSLCDSHSEGHPASNQSSSAQMERGVKRELENSESSTSAQNPQQQQQQRARKSRWGEKVHVATPIPGASPTPSITPIAQQILPATGQVVTLTAVRRNDPALLKYAIENYGSVNLSEEDWKKAEEHYKINLLYQDMVRKRQEIDRLAKAGKFKYEYDSEEDVQGGTWEHKLREQEMHATQLWADALTKQAEGKHHIGDFLPPEELKKFMEKYDAVKNNKQPDLSDYKEFKLREDNVGFQLLQKLGWKEGTGLGAEGNGILEPVNK